MLGGADTGASLVRALHEAGTTGYDILAVPPALMEDRRSHAPMIDAMAYDQALRLGTDPMDEMLMRMIMPDQPRQPSLASLVAIIAAMEAAALRARRPRPFRPTGNKRSRRRRKG